MRRKKKGVFPFLAFYALFAVSFGGAAIAVGALFASHKLSEDFDLGFFLIFVLAFGGVGLLFTVLTIREIINSVKKEQARERLLTTGSRVSAEIVGVKDANITVNGASGYYFLCHYSENDRDYVFQSELLTDDLGFMVGRHIDVWVNRDFSEYYVDIDALMP